MSPFRVAALLAIYGIVFCVVGESASAQNSATKQATGRDDIAKSIAESVSGTLQFAEGNFLGVAEAMPEDKNRNHNGFLVHVHADILDVTTHLSCLLGGKLIRANVYLSPKVKVPSFKTRLLAF